MSALRNARSGTLSSLRRGEVWLRNAFVFPRAWIAYQEALRAAPHDPLVLETVGSRAQYLGFPEIAIPALERIGRGLELTLATAYDEEGRPGGRGALGLARTRGESAGICTPCGGVNTSRRRARMQGRSSARKANSPR